jgi:hypothetical protein
MSVINTAFVAIGVNDALNRGRVGLIESICETSDVLEVVFDEIHEKCPFDVVYAYAVAEEFGMTVVQSLLCDEAMRLRVSAHPHDLLADVAGKAMISVLQSAVKESHPLDEDLSLRESLCALIEQSVRRKMGEKEISS